MGCSVGVGAVQLSIPSLPAGDYILVIDGNTGQLSVVEFKEFVGGSLLAVEFKGFKGVYQKSEDNIQLSWVMPTLNSIIGFDVKDALSMVLVLRKWVL